MNAKQDTALVYRLADMKPKDQLKQWLQHLLVNTKKPTTTVGVYRSKEEEQGAVVGHFAPVDCDYALKELERWWQHFTLCLSEPSIFSSDLLNKAVSLYTTKKNYGELKPFEQKDFDKFWRDDFNQRGSAFDAYYQYFFPETPSWSDEHSQIAAKLWQPIVEHFKEGLPQGDEA